MRLASRRVSGLSFSQALFRGSQDETSVRSKILWLRVRKLRRTMPNEETFDPQDWEAFSELAHRMLADTLGHLQSLSELPAWQPMPDEIRQSFGREVPRECASSTTALAPGIWICWCGHW
jgi:hypothetical protein